MAALAVVAVTLAPAPAAAASSATVQVDANAFAPFEVAVDVDGSVTWLVREGGHTIVADDGRFRFRGDGGTTLPAGTTVSVDLGRDEYVTYHCEIHGGPGLQGMAGRIRVGTPPAPPPHEAPVIRVPDDTPTLADAIARAAPGHRIELGPGDHPIAETATVDVDDLTIVGVDATTRLVPVASGRGFPSTALHITAARVRVEQLHVGAFRSSGIHLDEASATTILDVTIEGEGFSEHGIVATTVSGATLRRTTTTGNRSAGVVVSDCAACGVLVEESHSHGNGVGVLLESARGVTVRRSTIGGNGDGLVGRTARTARVLRPVVVILAGNTITGNEREGVRLSGPSDSTVADNHTDSIVIAGDWAERTVVSANRVTGALLWDGIGRQVTFGGNTDAAGVAKEPTLEPAAALR